MKWEELHGCSLTGMTSAQKIQEVQNRITQMLLKKNEQYGDSALNPTKVFSKLNASEAIKVRMDDKLSRIANSGITDATIDTLYDLGGYVALLIIALEQENRDRELLLQEVTERHQAEYDLYNQHYNQV